MSKNPPPQPLVFKQDIQPLWYAAWASLVAGSALWWWAWPVAMGVGVLVLGLLLFSILMLTAHIVSQSGTIILDADGITRRCFGRQRRIAAGEVATLSVAQLNDFDEPGRYHITNREGQTITFAAPIIHSEAVYGWIQRYLNQSFAAQAPCKLSTAKTHTTKLALLLYTLIPLCLFFGYGLRDTWYDVFIVIAPQIALALHNAWTYLQNRTDYTLQPEALQLTFPWSRRPVRTIPWSSIASVQLQPSPSTQRQTVQPILNLSQGESLALADLDQGNLFVYHMLAKRFNQTKPA